MTDVPLTDITKNWLVQQQLVHVTWQDVQQECARIVRRSMARRITSVYGIPRGGCTPAAIIAERRGLVLLDRPDEITDDTLIVDDLVDSGRTAATVNGTHYFDALYRKAQSPRDVAPDATQRDGWLVFPWEQNTADEAGPADAVVRLLEYIGEDPTRDGLRDTPDRVLRAFTEMTDGHSVNIEALLTRTFDHDGYTGMVVVRDVDFVSLCEHHLLPFTGRATVAYIPGLGREDGSAGRRVVGLSKLARLVDAFAHRLQIQERMTEQIADALVQHLRPTGVGVVLRATHSCMSCRGVRKADAEMVTSSLRGALYDKPEARAEFMRLAGC